MAKHLVLPLLGLLQDLWVLEGHHLGDWVVYSVLLKLLLCLLLGVLFLLLLFFLLLLLLFEFVDFAEVGGNDVNFLL